MSLRSDKNLMFEQPEDFKSEVMAVEATKFKNFSKQSERSRNLMKQKNCKAAMLITTGDIHFASDCPYENQDCSECYNKGHRAGYCILAQRKPFKRQTAPYKTNTICISTKNDCTSKRKIVEPKFQIAKLWLQLDAASD